MKTALVTGAAGFIGRHLVEALRRKTMMRVIEVDTSTNETDFTQGLGKADIVFHLAGVNRPESEAEFETGNVGFTKKICAHLEKQGQTPLIVFSSSIHATLENPYGISKRHAEAALRSWSARTGGRVAIFRLKNVFGKWCRPNYNSVIATFCNNIAKGLSVNVSDADHELDFIYIDDVVEALLEVENGLIVSEKCGLMEIQKSHKITLGRLAEKIHKFKDSRATLELPTLSDEFDRRLYATYLSYLDETNLAYSLSLKSDCRGSLAEFIKNPHFGQVFLSRTTPGVMRGNHFHHTKAEKFLVLEGKAIIRLRRLDSETIVEYCVAGSDFKVVDIPPGYVHSIQNVGDSELVTLFWASEIFNPSVPDTNVLGVLPSKTG